jgi:HEAT repeat protein
MGLFDFLSKSKAAPAATKAPSEREIARLARLCGDKLAQNYDRQEAIDTLAKIGTAASSRALLKRFDWSMDPSITDQDEKEAALRGIVAAGEASLEPIRDYCARAESITWALKALRQISPAESLADELLSVLDRFDTEYMRNAQPKIQIIAALADHKSSEVREAVEPFLEDANETVRFQAVTTLFALGDAACFPLLVNALIEDESLRVKNRIAAGLVDKNHAVDEAHLEALAEGLPSEFKLVGRFIQRR